MTKFARFLWSLMNRSCLTPQAVEAALGDTSDDIPPISGATARALAREIEAQCFPTAEPKDRYDVAVEYLTKHPEDIQACWTWPWSDHPGGCLFLLCSKDQNRANGCGCLTQVRAGTLDAERYHHTLAIRADERLPANPNDIRVEDLPVFAEWQRKLDRELGR